MPIIPQSAVFSCCALPLFPLLAAPPERKLLCAPKIAGLLPAVAASQTQVIVDEPLTLEQVLCLMGPIQSREEMDAEIVAFIKGELRKERLQ